jgi:hypothetical protein
VHFPTDLNLLYDTLGKGLDMVKKLKEISDIKGWRKIKPICSTTKSLFGQASQQVFRSNGKNEQQKRQAVKDYMHQSPTLQQRFEELIKIPPAGDTVTILALITALQRYT